MKRNNADFKQYRDDILASDSELAIEYERLAPRFRAINELIRARANAAVSQSELARRMNVNANVVSRLESAEHSPRVDTLALAAEALGYEVRVSFVKKRRVTSDAPRGQSRGKPPAKGVRAADNRRVRR